MNQPTNPATCPECTAGKHSNCDGTAWDAVEDRETLCECSHGHDGETSQSWLDDHATWSCSCGASGREDTLEEARSSLSFHTRSARDVSGSARARGAVDGGAAVTDPQTSETPQRWLLTDDEVQAVAPRTVLRVHDGSIVARFDQTHGVVFGDDRPFPWTVCRAPSLVLWADGDPTAPPAETSVTR